MQQGLGTASAKARACFQWSESFFYRHRSIFILAFAAVSVILVGGKRRCFSIFLGELHEQFNSTKLELNMIGDSYAATGFFLMPFAATGILTFGRRYGAASIAAAVLIFVSCIASSLVPAPGWMFLTHTLIHGVGSTLAMTSAALIVGEYFDRSHRFHVLTTTLVSGGPFGAIIFCPIYALWIREDGWRAAFRYMGAIFLVEMLAAGLVYTPRQLDYDDLDKQAAADGVANGGEQTTTTGKSATAPPASHQRRTMGFCTLKEMRERPPIVLWIVQRMVHNIVMYSIAMNLYDFEYDSLAYLASTSSSSNSSASIAAAAGLNSTAMLNTAYATEEWTEWAKAQASKVQLCYTVGESLIYVAGLVFGDKIRGRLVLCYVVGSATLTGTLFVWFFARLVTKLQLFLALLAGVAVGSGNTMAYATAEEVMNLDGSVAFPMSRMGAGLGMLVAPLLSGLVIDRLTFSGFFLIQSGLSLVSLSLLVGITVMMRRLAHTESAAAGTALQEHCSDSCTQAGHSHGYYNISGGGGDDAENTAGR